jgi:hypothetical protein
MSVTLAPNQSAASITGVGSVLSIGGLTGLTGTETFIVVGEVTDFKWDGGTRATTPVTNFGSGGVVQKVSTTLDLGTMTFTTNRIGNNAGQLAVIAAMNTGGAYDFKVQLPVNPNIGQTTTGDLITCSAIVTKAGGFDLSLNKTPDYTFTIDLNSYTMTAGS